MEAHATDTKESNRQTNIATNGCGTKEAQATNTEVVTSQNKIETNGRLTKTVQYTTFYRNEINVNDRKPGRNFTHRVNYFKGRIILPLSRVRESYSLEELQELYMQDASQQLDHRLQYENHIDKYTIHYTRFIEDYNCDDQRTLIAYETEQRRNLSVAVQAQFQEGDEWMNVSHKEPSIAHSPKVRQSKYVQYPLMPQGIRESYHRGYIRDHYKAPDELKPGKPVKKVDIHYGIIKLRKLKPKYDRIETTTSRHDTGSGLFSLERSSDSTDENIHKSQIERHFSESSNSEKSNYDIDCRTNDNEFELHLNMDNSVYRNQKDQELNEAMEKIHTQASYDRRTDEDLSYPINRHNFTKIPNDIYVHQRKIIQMKELVKTSSPYDYTTLSRFNRGRTNSRGGRGRGSGGRNFIYRETRLNPSDVPEGKSNFPLYRFWETYSKEKLQDIQF